MAEFSVTDFGLGESKLVIPQVFTDTRGFLFESYNEPKYRAFGIDRPWPQDTVSVSRRGVLRGLHCDPEMAKLVQVLHGAVYDVIVDMRPGSPTYRQWQSVELSDRFQQQLYVPPGFAHGFLALAEGTVFHYKFSMTWDPAREQGYRWDDPALGIVWPLESIGGAPLVSPKDAAAPLLA
ncbi:MAG TPA: dTDP-4-dehydrorhamnose 3,5-epimerase [Candidatus Dormibacteraeota bacterium]|nr:dTDP-4-dehydrorhamnose 3,5-epimerase [Candidatus Dormibacteraeota bacterium]